MFVTEWIEKHSANVETIRWLERYACEVPPDGATYRVLKDTWEDDGVNPPRRTILEVELVDA